MALYAEYNPYANVAHAFLQWHLDDDVKPLIEDVHHLVQVRADGTELAYIKERFKGTIPFPVMISRGGGMSPTKPSEQIRANFPSDLGLNPIEVTWYGSMAKFIVANL